MECGKTWEGSQSPSMKPVFHMKEKRVDCNDRMAVIQSVLMTTIYRHVIKRLGEQN